MLRYLISIAICMCLVRADMINPESVTASLHTLEADNVSAQDNIISSVLKAHESHVPALFKRYQATTEEYKVIEAKFSEADIPLFFSLIPYAESKFNSKSRGYGTAGLWQFNKQSARNFGLTVKKGTDERLDTERATDAAIRYIKSLKREFGTWYLADFAYAMGEGTLKKLIKKNQSKDISVLLRDPHFPSGTKSHFAKTLLLNAKIHHSGNTAMTAE